MTSTYFILRQGKKSGPFPASLLKTMAAGGLIGPDDLLWKEGQMKWIPAGNMKGLFPEVSSSGQQPPLPKLDVKTPSSPISDSLEGTQAPLEDSVSLGNQKSPVPSDVQNEEWFFKKPDQTGENGPVSFRSLNTLAADSQVKPDDLIRRTGSSWVRAEEFLNSFNGAESSAVVDEDLWYIQHRHKPKTFEKICELAEEGGLGSGVLIWKDGSKKIQSKFLVPAFAESKKNSFAESEENSRYFVTAAKTAAGGAVLWLYFGGFFSLVIVGALIGLAVEHFYGDETGKSSVKNAQISILILFALAFFGFVGSPVGAKLAAFRTVVRVYSNFPSEYASKEEREAFNEKLNKAQDKFFKIEFSPTADRKQAQAIVDLFRSRIEGNYKGLSYMLLEEHISNIYADLTL